MYKVSATRNYRITVLLQGSMHILILLLCFSTLEAKKQRVKSSSPLPKNLDKIESKDETFERPVDFTHVYREGFGDKDYKQPIHLLELDMIRPKNKEHALQLVQNTHKHNIKWNPKDDTLIFNNPRDEFLYYKNKHEPTKNASTPGNKRHVYDFLKMLERNLAYPAIERRKNSEVEKSSSEPIVKSKLELKKNISDIFENNAFYLKSDSNKINWTSCDEFSEKALFHSHDIVNTEWVPFYLWSKRGFSTAVVHVFTYPTKKIWCTLISAMLFGYLVLKLYFFQRVNYYRTSFSPYVKNIDWTQPKLLLKERREILLISSDRLGLFYGIPDQAIPTPEQGNVTLPPIILRIKIHSPYIAMMYCDEFYSTIMAERGTEPSTNIDKTREASTLRFRGIGVPVYQDLESEKMFAQVSNLRKLAAEERNTLKIRKIVGDVDYAVRH